MIKKVTELITSHYKSAVITGINIEDGIVYLHCTCKRDAEPYIAKRIIDTYPEMRRVEFVDFITRVYSKATLHWMGYYN